MPKCDSVKFQSNIIEITLRHRCSPVNLLHIFGTHFPKNTSWGADSESQLTLSRRLY